MNADQFFTTLWADYIALTPQANKVHEAVLAKNARIVNDHVAFRTFNLTPVCIANLEPHLFQMGYTAFESYHFEQKKLDAWAYVHSDP